MATDTKVQDLVVNKLSKSQYEGITTKSNTETYFINDDGLAVAVDKISNLKDVTISSVSNNDVLTYNSTDNKWENKNVLSDTISPVDINTGVLGTSNKFARQDHQHPYYDYKGGLIKNSVFRETNLGTVTNNTDWINLLTNTEASDGYGTLALGNYFTINDGTSGAYNVDWMIAQFGYTNIGGYVPITVDCLGLIPRTIAGTSAMNSSNTTVGGYKSAEIRTNVLTPMGESLKNNIFGSYLIQHDRLLSNAINATGYNRFGNNSGCTSGWEWVTGYCELMTEVQVYGSEVWSSSGYDTGEGCEKLPIFNFIHYNIYSRSNFWLRSVASATYFCLAGNNGGANYAGASRVCGVRPLIWVKVG